MTKPPKPSRIIGTGVLVAGSAKVEATARVFRRLPPDHPVHNLVGRVANEWAFVEHLLDEIIWHLAGLDAPTGACLTAQIVGSWSRMLTITALCTHRGVGQPVLNQISDVARQLHGVQARRNRILHDPWYLEDGSQQTQQYKAMPKDELVIGFQEVTEDYLNETIQKIGRRIEMIMKMRQAITAAL
jgi:hypothetical protein